MNCGDCREMKLENETLDDKDDKICIDNIYYYVIRYFTLSKKSTQVRIYKEMTKITCHQVDQVDQSFHKDPST